MRSSLLLSISIALAGCVADEPSPSDRDQQPAQHAIADVATNAGPGVCELAEEILGMPVRVAMPTGIKGITQLVHGPEFSTGVGLVKYGAQIIAEGALQTGLGSVPPPAARGRAQSREDIVEPRKSGFWEWIKAAF